MTMRSEDRPTLGNDATSLRASLQAAFSPATAQLLQEAVSPEPNFQHIAAILKTDPALTTAILGLVNSPYYGQQGKIQDLQRAALILGNNEILRIALSLSLQKNLDSSLKEHKFDTYANWRVIIWAALGAELIAEQLAPAETQTAYICALIKDLSLLLYAATFPDHVRSRLKQPDFVNTGPNFLTNQEDILANHTTVTAELLQSWNFPDNMIAAIASHHDLDRVLDYPPLTQAVILGTRWAEIEFQTDPAVDTLAQWAFLLAKAGVQPQGGLESLRQRCASRFSEMTAAMNVQEQPPEARLYVHSLQSLQGIQCQTKELEGLVGGNEAVAACIGRHLRWNWACHDAEVILHSAMNGQWEQFTLNASGQTGPFFAATLREFAMRPGLRLPLETEGQTVGELRVFGLSLSKQTRAEMALYARLLARCIWQRTKTVAQLEAKADILDILPTGVALLDKTGSVVRANPAFIQLEATAPTLRERLKPPAPDDRSQNAWRAFLRDPTRRSYCSAHCSLRPESGTDEPAFVLSGYRTAHGGQTVILALAQTLGEIRMLEVEALHQRDFLLRLLDAMQDLVMTVDMRGHITFASGSHSSFLIGKNLFRVTAPLDTQIEVWDMAALEQAIRAVEVKLTLRDEQRQLELVFSRFSYGDDYGLVVGRDMSLIRRLEQKIRQQAVFDSLTQIFNRHQLIPILEREISRAQRTNLPLGLIFGDLDRFKQFNDTHGHQAGDDLLKKLGQMLRSVLRKGYDFPCRFGGDELIVVSSNVNADSLLTIAERIRNEVAQLGMDIITLSIGATLLEPDDTPTSLLERADRACYQAKNQGGNSTVCIQSDTSAK